MAIQAKHQRPTFDPARRVSPAQKGRLKGETELRLEKIKEMAAALLNEAESLDHQNALAENSETFNSLTGKTAVDFFEEVRRFESRLIRRALQLAEGNHARAAKMLGLGVTTLKYKIKSYADTEEFRRSAKSIRELDFAGMWANRSDITDGVSYVDGLRDKPRS